MVLSPHLKSTLSAGPSGLYVGVDLQLRIGIDWSVYVDIPVSRRVECVGVRKLK